MRAGKVREGPRLEVQKHRDAEERLRTSIIRKTLGEPWDYEGREEDILLVQRKQRELGPERIRRVVGGA